MKTKQMTWFEKLVGFKEESPANVRENIVIEGEYLTSKINRKTYKHGSLEIATLKELKESSEKISKYNSKLLLEEVVGDVQSLHEDRSNTGTMFQAASQFNLLEMVGPSVSPEQGISEYEDDYTQGPACAIACGAGTIYRNYFVEIGDQIGQTRNKQIDCLEEIGKVWKNEKKGLWKMKNGYALATLPGLQKISTYIEQLNAEEYEKLKEKLKIGIQWDTEVTLSNEKQTVSQAYCAALPVAYSRHEPVHWEKFAKLILEATYEATFYAALRNYERIGNKHLYLTLVGGGAFGNDIDWILEAIGKSIKKFHRTPLEVKIVSYGQSNEAVRRFVDK